MKWSLWKMKMEINLKRNTWLQNMVLVGDGEGFPLIMNSLTEMHWYSSLSTLLNLRCAFSHLKLVLDLFNNIRHRHSWMLCEWSMSITFLPIRIFLFHGLMQNWLEHAILMMQATCWAANYMKYCPIWTKKDYCCFFENFRHFAALLFEW